MELTAHLNLLRRHWLPILLTTLVAFAVTYSFTIGRAPASHETTLFLNFGARQGQASTSYDDVQAADQFTESVQGWFKNPDLLQRIESTAQVEAALSARKQEKQNLVVTFYAENEEQAQTIADATIEELRQEIDRYNEQTQSSFALAIASVTIAQQPAKTIILSLLGLVLGLVLAIGLAYLREYLFGIASFRAQVEKTLQKRSDDVLALRWGKQDLGVLETLIRTEGEDDVRLIGVNVSPQNIEAKLELEAETITFPQDASALTKKAKNTVVLCKLGTTRIQDLERLTAILPKEYILVTSY